MSENTLPRVPLFALGFVALASCTDPFPMDTTPKGGGNAEPPPQEEICEATDAWLPVTPDMEQFNPPAHPEGECPFYRGVWHNFLLATQPDPGTGRPAIQSYPTI